MARSTCPRCGAPLESDQSTCRHCRGISRKNSVLTPFFVIGGIVAFFIVIVVFLFMTAPPAPEIVQHPEVTMPPAAGAVQAPAPPACSIAIAGSKIPPSSVQLRVMTSTCTPGDVSELRVSVNGVSKGTLTPNTGSSGTFSATSGTNNVLVIAKYANGVEGIVFSNAAL